MPNVTSVWDFSPGETLTAAKLDDVNCGIHVFSGTATRDAAYGGSGERTLAEGEFAYLADTNTTQYYDGSAWQTLVVGGLTLVKAQTIGSAVSSVTVTDAFSATYDNYLITANGGAGSQNSGGTLILGSTTTGYYYGANYCSYVGSGGVYSGANTTSIEECFYISPNSINCQIVVKNPNLAKNTLFNWQVSGAATSSIALNVNGGGYLANTTQYTAFTLSMVAGTMTGGTIRVYGYANS